VKKSNLKIKLSPDKMFEIKSNIFITSIKGSG
jgi:hypothetical protein